MQRRCFLVMGGFALGGCALPFRPDVQPRPEIARDYDLQGLRFAARPGLSISEREVLYPVADIVWRGDPLGPRIEQIETMFETAVERNQHVITGRRPIVLEVTLLRFHGVTKRARYHIGGVYNINFQMTVRDAHSNAVIEPPRVVIGEFETPGGELAVRLEETGQTEKVRVTDFLTRLIYAQLV